MTHACEPLKDAEQFAQSRQSAWRLLQSEGLVGERVEEPRTLTLSLS
jgi:hypothetical protein